MKTQCVLNTLAKYHAVIFRIGSVIVSSVKRAVINNMCIFSFWILRSGPIKSKDTDSSGSFAGKRFIRKE